MKKLFVAIAFLFAIGMSPVVGYTLGFEIQVNQPLFTFIVHDVGDDYTWQSQVFSLNWNKVWTGHMDPWAYFHLYFTEMIHLGLGPVIAFGWGERFGADAKLGFLIPLGAGKVHFDPYFRFGVGGSSISEGAGNGLVFQIGGGFRFRIALVDKLGLDLGFEILYAEDTDSDQNNNDDFGLRFPVGFSWLF
jgi:hypothetical protein